GDREAAMRYTEARLHRIVEKGFFARVNKQGVIPKINNYDDTQKEPVVLPAMFPNVLVNGSSGIYAGYATEIAPHSLTEVLDGCIHLLKKLKSTLYELMEIIRSTDFAIGGDRV